MKVQKQEELLGEYMKKETCCPIIQYEFQVRVLSENWTNDA